MNQSPTSDGFPLSRSGRVLIVLWCLFLLSGFCLAVWLSPDSRGFGTHQQLGLPPCSFQQLFGVPCPSCGMTTSFSHFVRGQWILSAQSSVTAFVLALVCVVQIPWFGVSVWKNRLWRVRHPDLVALGVLGFLYAVWAAEWLVRFLRS